MSTSPETVAFIEDQLAGLCVRTLRMFGEYGIYCDDSLFLKPSSADSGLFARTEPAPPVLRGVKPHPRRPAR